MNAIFITVRTGSTRLPQKAIRKIGDKCTIEYVIERAKMSKESDLVVLCTTQLPEDDILCEIADRNGIHYFRGSTEDKLMRWKDATDEFGVNFFVTADGDDLLCDPELIDAAFVQYEATGVDFIEGKNIPCGAFSYGIKTSALNKVCDMKDTTDTEMMWSYFTKTGLFDVASLSVPEVFHRPEIRMTLDYRDDLKFFEIVLGHFTDTFTLRDVLKFLDENPEVIKVNQYLQERFLANQQANLKVIIKNEPKQISWQ